MSVSSLFYTLMGDKSIVFKSMESHPTYVIFRGRLKKSTHKCSSCNSTQIRIQETKERTFRMVNLGEKKTYLKTNIHKFYCKRCDKKGWMRLSFTSGKLPMTISFMCYILQLTAMTTILSVAFFLGLSWKTVKNIDKNHLKKRSKQFSFRKLKYISIDEIAIRKNHKYMTIFTDISTGQIIHAIEGRNEEALRPFLKLLSKKAKHLKGIGIDMSAAYSSSIKKHLPNIAIIFDRFHVTKLLNEAIDKIRRSECIKFQNKGFKVFKGQRFLLLRNFADLEEDQKARLNDLLEINQSLAIAHSMKEQFRLFWDCKSEVEGAKFLVSWILKAVESGVEQLIKVTKTLLRHSKGLLSYFEHRISNGKAEGINNKIKVLKRNAYGYRDQEYFKLKLYNLHKSKFQLVG